jgi:hypothetical protein
MKLIALWALLLTAAVGVVSTSPLWEKMPLWFLLTAGAAVVMVLTGLEFYMDKDRKLTTEEQTCLVWVGLMSMSLMVVVPTLAFICMVFGF